MGQSRIPQLRAGRNSWEVEAILKMFFQTTFVFLALALSAHGERPSRDAINARLKNFDGFFSERVTVIHKAGDETKDAINSVSDELRQLLKMLADELKFTDDDIAKVTESKQQLEKELEAKEANITKLAEKVKSQEKLLEEHRDQVDNHAEENGVLKGVIEKIETSNSNMNETIKDLEEKLETHGGNETVSREK